MFTQSSMLIGCCRERHLTRIDPNAKDENVSWLCHSRETGNVKVWRNVNGIDEDNLIAYPASGYFQIDQTTPAPFNGFMHSPNMANAGYFAGPSKTSGRTSELYFRAVVYMGINSGTCNFASVTDARGNVIFSLSGISYGMYGWNITATWTDTKNKQQTMNSSKNALPRADWLDVKVFIPASGPAFIVVTPATLNLTGVAGANNEGNGFKDNVGDRLHVFSANGPVADWNPNYRIYRIGIGNKTSTAQP